MPSLTLQHSMHPSLWCKTAVILFKGRSLRAALFDSDLAIGLMLRLF